MTTAYTNYCCRSGGSNMNAGTVDGGTTLPATTPLVTYTGGNWDSTTDVYTAPIGADMTEAVVGRFASLYVDGDTTPTINQYLIGIITNVNSGSRTITISPTLRALFGTEVTTGTGNRSLRIGGAWAGPSGTNAFPLVNIGLQNAVTSNAEPSRINFKNDQTYSITAAMAPSNVNARYLSGFSAAYGDLAQAQSMAAVNALGGLPVIDGGTSGASYVPYTIPTSLTGARIECIKFENNGATGSAAGITVSATGCELFRVAVANVRGNGIAYTAGNLTECVIDECEVYGANQSNTASNAGINGTSSGGNMIVKNTIAHDNTGSNTSGFRFTGMGLVTRCIADSNGNSGIRISSSSYCTPIENSDCYNNGLDGITINGTARINNCNLLKNGTGGNGYGIAASDTHVVVVTNCGFGSGTEANVDGTVDGNVDEIGSVTYASNLTPWNDPANGDFSIDLAAARGAGHGVFLQTAPSYSGTVGYPDIGAAQTQSTGGGGLLVHPGMTGGFRG